MNRSAVASDLLDIIKACLGDRCKQYVFARARGIPPAECSSITTSWADRVARYDGECRGPLACQDWEAVHSLRFTITNICMGPDGKPMFDWQLEDLAAACFEDDVDAIESCLQCMDWSQLRTDHAINQIVYTGTTFDIEAEGGGYSAYIGLQIVAQECCP